METTLNAMEINIQQHIYALQHLETREFICLLQNGTDYLACFTDGDSALEFRSALGLQEHVDLVGMSMDGSPFRHFWLDGSNVELHQEVAN